MTEIPAPRRDVKAFLHPFYADVIESTLATVDRYQLMVHPPSNLASQFAEAWREWVRPCVDLSEFKYAYLGAGSSELIRECARQAVDMQTGYENSIYADPGEYEGWRYYVDAMGGKVEEPYQIGIDQRGTRYLSNPRSYDGNWMNPDHFNRILETQNSIVDLAYINTVPNRRIDVGPANAVIFSASKSLGMFYHRLGIVFCKQPQPALEGNNLWFHNPMSILLALEVMAKFECGSLHKLMSFWQSLAVTYYATSHSKKLLMAPSDSFLMGFDRKSDQGYLRPDTDFGNRYCLFPYYEAVREKIK